jgi:hypothetical protein
MVCVVLPEKIIHGKYDAGSRELFKLGNAAPKLLERGTMDWILSAKP